MNGSKVKMLRTMSKGNKRLYKLLKRSWNGFTTQQKQEFIEKTKQ